MFKDVFDPNKTIRHVSYRQERQRFEREKRLSDLFFKIMAIATMIGFFVFAVISVMAR